MTLFKPQMRALVVAAFAGILSACGGGGGSVPGLPMSPSTQPSGTTQPSGAPSTQPSSSPSTGPSSAPTPTPTPPVASPQTVVTWFGKLNGAPNMFTPAEGDTPAGGNGLNTVDGIPCLPVMSNNYHVHVFLGVYVNGQYVANPIAIGMDNPVAPTNGEINAATCFYYIHTHDSSGIVHLESYNPTNAPVTASIFTLQNLFDIWGITTDGNHFANFTGPVEVFTSGQVYRGNEPGSNVSSTTLTYYGNNAGTVPLYSHEVIIIEVGPTYPTSLPNVHFYTQY